MDWLYLTAFIFIGLAGMEIVSYCVHRWLFHGLLWKIHESHHKPNHSVFEPNDIFSLIFASISIWLMIDGVATMFTSPAFGAGAGIAVYGVLYFIIHDLFAYKRFVPFSSDNKIMKLIRKAHQRHHQDVGKEGHEPYGLFLFPYDEYPDRERKFDR